MNNFHQAFVKIKIPTAFAFEKVINNATRCFSNQAGAAAAAAPQYQKPAFIKTPEQNNYVGPVAKSEPPSQS
jgi:hypothetical protein